MVYFTDNSVHVIWVGSFVLNEIDLDLSDTVSGQS